MAVIMDLKLFPSKESDGLTYFDLGISSEGDFALEDGFDTSIIVSLFCERRAKPYEVAVPAMRRGWWGNTLSEEPGFEIGSRLWLLEQARLTTSTVNMFSQYAEEGLSWLKQDGFLADIRASAKAVIEEGEPQIELTVQLVRKDNTSEYRYYTVWEATGR